MTEMEWNHPLMRIRQLFAAERIEHNITRPGRIVPVSVGQTIDRVRVAQGLPARYGEMETEL